MLLDFLAEKGFDIRSVVEKGVRDKSLKDLAKEPAIRTSGVSSQNLPKCVKQQWLCAYPDELCVGLFLFFSSKRSSGFF